MNKGNLDLDISPDMGMYRILPQQSYDYSFALAEFIDNSIQAFENSKLESLHIKVQIFTSEYEKVPSFRNRIVVTDDGPGMEEKSLVGAFKPANKTQVHGLNEFGIGMKAAAIFFSDHWSMVTKSNSNSEFHIDFDLSKLLEHGKQHVTALRKLSNMIEGEHGTSITLHNVRKSIDLTKANEIKQRLSEIYRKFTARTDRPIKISMAIDGGPYCKLECKILEDIGVLVHPKSVNATVNGERRVYLVGDDRRWHVDLSFNVRVDDKDYTVSGYIYQLNTGNVADNPGISVFRYDRLILGLTNEKDQFKPKSIFGAANKHRAQRLYCEINIDGMPVSYTKDKLDFDETCLINGILSHDGVKELIDNAQNYRPEFDKNLIFRVNDESEIPTARKKQAPPEKKPEDPSKPKNKKIRRKKTEIELIREILKKLESSSILTLGLKHFLEELRWQLVAGRPISASVCLRVILEKGLLAKLKVDFPDCFVKFDGRGIQDIINNMNSNLQLYFPNNKPRAAAEVVKANSKTMEYGEVLLLNNVSHGDFSPEMSSVIKAITNLQPLLEWIYLESEG